MIAENEMIECPCCGYNPNPVEIRLTDAQLRHNKTLNQFNKNLQNTWWLTQPEYIFEWIKSLGIRPVSILDIGCGDGRFLPAIIKTFPEAEYAGIDKIEEHIAINKENFPEHKWLHGSVHTLPCYNEFDLVLLMGIFNPKMADHDQEAIIAWIKKECPANVIGLFDVQLGSGIRPDNQLLPEYFSINTLSVPETECGPKQKLIVSRYSREK